MEKFYFDYASTTPTDPRVVKAMEPFFFEEFGNTESFHCFGQKAKIVVDENREKVARLINAKAEEIVFTGSASESNNLALKGIAFKNRKKGNHIVISSVEHACILETADWLEKQGFEVTKAKVDCFGQVDPSDIEKSINEKTILVSVIHASNETGTIQPIKEIGRICREKKVYFHSDCAQSFGKIPIDVNDMNIDLLTVSGHKIYGPKGIGALFVRKGVLIEPLIHGGGQEQGIRSSTINLPGVVGLGKASEIYLKEGEKERKEMENLRKKIIKEINSIDKSFLNGHPTETLPNIINFRFSFIEGEALAMKLDLMGFAVSTASACASNKLKASHVLLAMGLKHHEAHGSLRISLGRWTKEKDLQELIEAINQSVNELREISPFKK